MEESCITDILTLLPQYNDYFLSVVIFLFVTQKHDIPILISAPKA